MGSGAYLTGAIYKTLDEVIRTRQKRRRGYGGLKQCQITNIRETSPKYRKEGKKSKRTQSGRSFPILVSSLKGETRNSSLLSVVGVLLQSLSNI